MKTQNFFFSGRTCDRVHVEYLRNSIRNIIPNFPFEDASVGLVSSSDWKDHAAKIIQDCDGLICVVCESTYKSENVDWEIREAFKHNKPVVVVRHDYCKLPNACEELGIGFVPSDVKVVARKICDLLIPKAIFNPAADVLDGVSLPAFLAQYNVMVQSWESLINRRQTVNNIYLSASTGILAVVVALLGHAKTAGSMSSCVCATAISILGVLISMSWRQVINSYWLLSQAKSQIVSALEKSMPVKLFDNEWIVLKSKDYKSTTELDMRVSGVCIIIFLVLMLLSLTFLSW